jgi:hypothetical protein
LPFANQTIFDVADDIAAELQEFAQLFGGVMVGPRMSEKDGFQALSIARKTPVRRDYSPRDSSSRARLDAPTRPTPLREGLLPIESRSRRLGWQITGGKIACATGRREFGFPTIGQTASGVCCVPH